MQLKISSIKSAVLVLLQFILIALISIYGNIFPKNIYIIILAALFLFPGIWAVFVMKMNFNISPEITDDKVPITIGPYRYIRHPMYLSVLGVCLCIVLNQFNITVFIFWIILTITLIIKMNYEEKIIERKHPEYGYYKKITKKIIPLIY